MEHRRSLEDLANPYTDDPQEGGDDGEEEPAPLDYSLREEFNRVDPSSGFLLVIDDDTVLPSDAEATFDSHGDQEIPDDKCTIDQMKVILRKLSDAGFQLEVNKEIEGAEDEKKTRWYIRLTMSEDELMAAAEEMKLMMKVRAGVHSAPSRRSVVSVECPSCVTQPPSSDARPRKKRAHSPHTHTHAHTRTYARRCAQWQSRGRAGARRPPPRPSSTASTPAAATCSSRGRAPAPSTTPG
jgi:hypothetical protein